MKVIGVRFKSSGRIYYFDPLDYEFNEGDGVIVETARGQEFGEVAQTAIEVEDTMIVSPLKPVVRPATEQDAVMREQNSAKEGDAFRICQQKIAQHKLDMRLVSAEYSFNGSKLIFYFTADERVDFRELVKDLAAQFRTRIELRQIGVRDEAKMLGGLGPCGRPVCCKAFLRDFHPVSIKMAKEQNLSLSPTKISGLCGRLMCCLQYEQACYEEMKRKMPRTGREIQTPDGVGTVVENNVITEKTKVRLSLPDGTIEVREFHYTMLAKPGEPLPVPKVEPKAEAVPETADPQNEPAQKPAAEKKRRRRGGRGRSGNNANGNGGGAGAQNGAKSSGGGSPKQSGPSSQHSQRPKQPQNTGKRPQQERGAQQKQPGDANGNPGAKGGSYKRRRGGSGRPANAQNAKPEQKS
ncbi:MAG TPA: stage 0 sporulation family protein [Eubacteriales bacterium]|nr:stage 0 sporulation family protein [Eubacteriales bacterium]